MGTPKAREVRGVGSAEPGRHQDLEPGRPKSKVGLVVGPEQARAVRRRHVAVVERPAADRALRFRHFRLPEGPLGGCIFRLWRGGQRRPWVFATRKNTGSGGTGYPARSLNIVSQ